MDIQMPVMDGYEATKELRKLMDDKTIPFIPIVAITAFPDEKDRCLTSGMTEFCKCYSYKLIYLIVDKPSSAAVLKEVLNKYVK
jgi:CheY-like chemotaxis protein